MKKQCNLRLFLSLGCVVLAFAATLAYTILRLTAFDAEVGHFSTAAEYILYLGAVVLFILPSLLSRNGALRRTYAVRLRTDFALLLLAIFSFVAALHFFGFNASASSYYSQSETIGRIFAVIVALLALLAVIAVAVTAVKKSVTSFSSAVFALFSIFYAMFLYLDQSTVLNSPFKLLSILAFIGFALASLLDCRVICGFGGDLLAFAFGAGASALGFAVAVPSLILYLVGESTPLPHTPVEELLLLSYTFYYLSGITFTSQKGGAA